MVRDFARTAIRVPNCPPVPAYEITCSKCGETEKISANNRAGAIPPERLNASFRNKGWIIGKKPSGDVCPACQAKKESNVVPLKQENAPTVVAEPPRQMNKEDRRLIWGKIEEVYLDNAYSSGWNDKKVAEDLGVPLAWVKNIRDENFGPEGLDDDALAILEQAKKLVKLAQNEASLIDGNIKAMQDARAAIFEQANTLAAAISAIEKKYK